MQELMLSLPRCWHSSQEIKTGDVVPDMGSEPSLTLLQYCELGRKITNWFRRELFLQKRTRAVQSWRAIFRITRLSNEILQEVHNKIIWLSLCGLQQFPFSS